MNTTFVRLTPCLLVCIAVAACASSKKPQLYPNSHYREVGVEVAEMDIAGCMHRADISVQEDSAAKTAATHTVVGAAGGAAVGAIAGAIAGSAGTGAAIGAATGGTLGAASGVYKGSQHSDTFEGYVEACLREKGYETIGWK